MEIQIFELHHRNLNCIGIKLNRNDSRIVLVRNIKCIKWSQTHHCWYGESSEQLLFSLQQIFGENSLILNKSVTLANTSTNSLPDERDIKDIQVITDNKFTKTTEVKLIKFSDWLNSKRYSPNTIRTYLEAIKTFIRFFKGKETGQITNDDIITFNNDYILKNNYSAAFQNQVVNAVKLFFKVNDNILIDLSEIHRPRRSRPLPNVLSKDEIKALLESLFNLKHQCMLSLAYSCGLRVGELISLVLQDIDSKRMVVMVKNSKGNKDRIVPLSPKILNLLQEYYKRFKPQKYLFEGEKPGSPYSNRSIQLVIKRATDKAGILKPVTMHWLRHSYATHLHESGTDIRFIQSLLGHNSTKTTEIYTHISTRSIQNIKSPFDSL